VRERRAALVEHDARHRAAGREHDVPARLLARAQLELGPGVAVRAAVRVEPAAPASSPRRTKLPSAAVRASRPLKAKYSHSRPVMCTPASGWPPPSRAMPATRASGGSTSVQRPVSSGASSTSA
jgi:hypothetical protein